MSTYTGTKDLLMSIHNIYLFVEMKDKKSYFFNANTILYVSMYLFFFFSIKFCKQTHCFNLHSLKNVIS